MESFNPELKVGMQAMIVGVAMPENAGHIGKMVTIAALCDIGESVQEWYDDNYNVLPLKYAMAIITGIGTGPHHKVGYATIQQKYLMPLPPLDDDAIIFANENVKETSKC
jgi:hypothetical protein